MYRKQVFFFLMVGIFSIVSVSCSHKSYTGISSESLIIFPPPPDTTRIQFLTTISGSLDITGKRSSFSRFLFGEYKDLGIEKPYGIAVHKNKVFVCDTKVKAIDIIDLENHSFEFFMPAGKGLLKKPVNCYVDENAYLFVADIGRKQIVIFDSIGNFVNSIGTVAEDSKPTDVFVKANKIWIVDFTKQRIDVYDRNNFEFLYSFPDSEPEDEDYLHSPTNIFVTDDKVYVTDFGAFKIKIYNHKGEFINEVGSFGRNIGQFVRPKGIAVDKDLNLYVVDAGFENTQIFNDNGELLMFFGTSNDQKGGMWLPAQVTVDYNNLEYFQKYVDDSFNLKYLIFITNQFGPYKVSIYGYVEPK